MRVMEDLLKSGKPSAPNAKVFWSLTHGRPEVSAADTQMINIEEMARMAQEGIEVETTESGIQQSESGGKEGQQEEMNAAEDGSGNQSPPFLRGVKRN